MEAYKSTGWMIEGVSAARNQSSPLLLKTTAVGSMIGGDDKAIRVWNRVPGGASGDVPAGCIISIHDSQFRMRFRT